MCRRGARSNTPCSVGIARAVFNLLRFRLRRQWATLHLATHESLVTAGGGSGLSVCNQRYLRLITHSDRVVVTVGY